jgi:hypothetical protein
MNEETINQEQPITEPQAPPKPEPQAPQPEPVKKSFLNDVKIETDPFSDHLQSLKNGKQVYEEAIKTGETNEKKDNNTSNTSGPSSEEIEADKRRKEDAITIAQGIDMLFWLGGYMKFNIPVELMKANHVEIEAVTTGAKRMLDFYKTKPMPPWATFAGALLFVYGIKCYSAFQYIKAKREAEEAYNNTPPPQDINQAHDNYKAQQEQKKSTEPDIKNFQNLTILKHHCALPGCNELITTNRKYCSGTHRTMHQNHIKYGSPIDLNKKTAPRKKRKK